MASKAYVVAMTVSELKEELKQRGLSTKGSKKDLRDRLEQALYDEELDDPSSGSESDDDGGHSYTLGFGGGGFNFEVPPESFIAEEDLVPDNEETECEPMIVSVELSNKEKLEVCPCASATTRMDVGVEGRSMGDRSLSPMVAPMIVEIDVPARQQAASLSVTERGATDNGKSKLSKTTAHLAAQIQSRNFAESALSIPQAVTINGGKVDRQTKQASSEGGAESGSLQNQMDVVHVTQDQLASQTEVLVANSLSEEMVVEKFKKQEVSDADKVDAGRPKDQDIESVQNASQPKDQDIESVQNAGGPKDQDIESVQNPGRPKDQDIESVQNPGRPKDQKTESLVDADGLKDQDGKSLEDADQHKFELNVQSAESDQVESAEGSHIGRPECEETGDNDESMQVDKKEACVSGMADASNQEEKMDEVSYSEPFVPPQATTNESSNLELSIVASDQSEAATSQTEPSTQHACTLQSTLSVQDSDQSQASSSTQDMPQSKSESQAITNQLKTQSESIQMDATMTNPTPSTCDNVCSVPETVADISQSEPAQESSKQVMESDSVEAAMSMSQSLLLPPPGEVPEQSSPEVTNVPQLSPPAEAVNVAQRSFPETSQQPSSEVPSSLPPVEAPQKPFLEAIIPPPPPPDQEATGVVQQSLLPDESQPLDSSSQPTEGLEQSSSQEATAVCEQSSSSPPQRTNELEQSPRVVQSSPPAPEATSSSAPETVSDLFLPAPEAIGESHPPAPEAISESQHLSPPAPEATNQSSSLLPEAMDELEQLPEVTGVPQQSLPLSFMTTNKSELKVDITSVTFKSTEKEALKQTSPLTQVNVFLSNTNRPLSQPSLLESPGRSFDDTSSLMVEPPSPRSESSILDMPSFSEATPMDGQANPLELSIGVQDLDEACSSEPEVVELEANLPSKDTQTEEKVGSEISSELSSLPPPIDDDANEEGLPHGEGEADPKVGGEVSEKISPMPKIGVDEIVETEPPAISAVVSGEDSAETRDLLDAQKEAMLVDEEKMETEEMVPVISQEEEGEVKEECGGVRTESQPELQHQDDIQHQVNTKSHQDSSRDNSQQHQDSGKEMQHEQTADSVTTRAEVSNGSLSVGVGKEEVSGPTVDSGQIEVDLLVHAEAEDLSVFSSEAAEADQLRALSSSGALARKGSSKRSSSKPANAASSSMGGGERRASLSSRGNSPGKTSSRKSPPPSSSSARESKRQRDEKPEVHVDPPIIKRRRISANSGSSSSQVGVAGGGETRKRRWGTGRQRSSSGSTTTAISTDILKEIIPGGVEELENVVSLEIDMDEIGSSHVTGNPTPASKDAVSEGDKESKREFKQSLSGSGVPSAVDKEWEEVEREREARKREMERARQELETRKRIEARLRAKQEVEGKARRESTENTKRRTPSPARHPPSKLVHVDHLTRPFTKVQLLDILTKDGPIIPQLLWSNKIKSHCIALYQSMEAAVATRKRLHGIKWPSTNPKLLSVDFLTAEEARKLTEGELVIEEELVREDRGKVGVVRTDAKIEEEKEKESKTDVLKMTQERETVDSKEVAVTLPSPSLELGSNRPKDPVKDRHTSQSSASGEGAVEPEVVPAPSQSPPKKEATRLLDELFRKTKTTPCIYWLPLTKAEVAERELKEKAREAEREQRREERARQLEEERRAREKERRERHERLEAEREHRARERLKRSRSRSRSHERRGSRSRDKGRRR